MALGIGDQVSASELRKIVDDEDDVMTVDSFDDLLSSLHLVSEKICASAGERIPCLKDGFLPKVGLPAELRK